MGTHEAGANFPGRHPYLDTSFHIRWDNDQPHPVTLQPTAIGRSVAVSMGSTWRHGHFPPTVSDSACHRYVDAHYTKTIELDGDVIIQRACAVCPGSAVALRHGLCRDDIS
jgi:hypothetical protein